MLRFKKIAFSALLLLFLTVSCLGEDATTNRQLLDSADEILAEVSRIRNLPVKRQVEKGVQSKPEIESFLMERINEEYPREEIEKEARLLKRLGLIPDTLDLYAFIVTGLTEFLHEVADPHSLLQAAQQRDGVRQTDRRLPTRPEKVAANCIVVAVAGC